MQDGFHLAGVQPGKFFIHNGQISYLFGRIKGKRLPPQISLLECRAFCCDT
jgi:hypothetical protein